MSDITDIYVKWTDKENGPQQGALLQFLTTSDGYVMGVVACKLRIVLVHYDELTCILQTDAP